MKNFAVNILLCTYLFLMVRPAVPLAADFVAHTLWSHHHHHAHHHGNGHHHLQDDLKKAQDEQGDEQKNVKPEKAEWYFAPEQVEFCFLPEPEPLTHYYHFSTAAYSASIPDNSPPPEAV